MLMRPEYRWGNEQNINMPDRKQAEVEHYVGHETVQAREQYSIPGLQLLGNPSF
jgi:hypothetical protein